MSRPKQFPEKLYVGMSKQKSDLFIFDENVAKALTALGQKVATYTLYMQQGYSGPRNPRKAPTPAGDPVAPKEQDRQPQGQAGAKDEAVGTKGRHRKVPSSDGFGPPLTD